MKKLCFTITALLLLSYSKISEATFLTDRLKLPSIEYTIEEKLLNIFVANGLDTVMSKILVAQASHESGKFTNSLTKKYKNIFALTECVKNCNFKKRKTLSLGGHGFAEGRYGYSTYSSLDSAAVDMLYYMESKKIPTNFTSATEYSKVLREKFYYEGDKTLSNEQNIKLYAAAVYAHYKKIWIK